MHPLPLQRLERSKAVKRLELLERLVFIAGGTRSTAMIPVTAGCAMRLSMPPKEGNKVRLKTGAMQNPRRQNR
jgi:hypothetical protein